MLSIDYYRVRAKERRVSAAVSQLGGRMASIPFWPLGSEYRISFERSLTPDEIDSLTLLNELRGWVGLRFLNLELTEDERGAIAEKLSFCHVIDQSVRKHPLMQP